MAKWLVTFLVVLLPIVLHAETMPVFEIQGARITLHESSDFSSPVVARLRRLNVIQQVESKNCWIKVKEVNGREREGWVYGPMVGRLIVEMQEPPPQDSIFGTFKQELEQLNWKLRNTVGNVFFTGAKDLGDGAVQITASRAWLATPVRYRENNLNTILNRWSTKADAEQSLSIQVVDNRGELRMAHGI